MNNSKIESGIELFKRTNQVSVERKHLHLFPYEGPYPGEMVEITGPSGSGKTYLLMYYMIKSTLPRELVDESISGTQCNVIFVNCDHKFEIFKLINLIETYVFKNVPRVKKEIRNIVKSCLERMTILNCYDYNQFFVTLHKLESLVKKSETVTVVVIDSLCSYYWACKLDKPNLSYANFYNNNLEILKDCVQFLNIVCFYSIGEEFSSQSKNKKVDYSIGLSCNKDLILGVLCNSKRPDKRFVMDFNLKVEYLD